MNFLQMELKKILSITKYRENAVYIGNSGYVRVNEDVRLRLGFFRSSTSTYDGLVMTMINRTEGAIDTNVLKFKDIWGYKAVSNPNFKEGIIPYIWENGNKAWYVYKPNQKDYQMLADEINQYVGLFQESEMAQGPQINM
ncbi:hypothetical protein AAAU22_01260 [[Clostridium] symbiosum]